MEGGKHGSLLCVTQIQHKTKLNARCNNISHMHLSFSQYHYPCVALILRLYI